MKRAMTNRKTNLLILVTIMCGLMLQACHSEKKCGCGTDLNSVYKVYKRHRR